MPSTSGVDELHLGLRFEARIRLLDAEHAGQTFADVVAGDRGSLSFIRLFVFAY